MRYLIFLLTLACASACTPPRDASATTATTSAATADDPATPGYTGEWDVTVTDTPAGTLRGTLLLEQGEEGLQGSFVVDGAETELRSVTATPQGLKLSFYSSQYSTDVNMDLKGSPEEERLVGTTLGSFQTTAVRKM